MQAEFGSKNNIFTWAKLLLFSFFYFFFLYFSFLFSFLMERVEFSLSGFARSQSFGVQQLPAKNFQQRYAKEQACQNSAKQKKLLVNQRND